MNKRGSALVNVLVVVTVLMILGMAAMRFVAADANFSRMDYNRSEALQVAEGGIDYAMEKIGTLGEGESLNGEFHPSDGLVVEITDWGNGTYTIKSTATEKNSTRTIEVEVSRLPATNPFDYSLFIGSSETTGHIRNVTFHNPVYIASRVLDFGPGVVFAGGVHFEHEEHELEFTGSHTYTIATGAPEATFGESGMGLPDIDVYSLKPYADNLDTSNTNNNLNSTQVEWEHLKTFNFFSGDVDITWGGNASSPAAATEGYIVIVADGDVRFIGNSNLDYTPFDAVIVFANGSASGALKKDKEAEPIDNVQLPLWIYAKETVVSRNNLNNLHSLVGDVVTIGEGNQPIEAGEIPVGVPGLDDLWPSKLRITNWKN